MSELETFSAPRPQPTVRSARQGKSPLVDLGTAATPRTLPGRPAVAVHRIIESAAILRPERITRLHLTLHPDPLGEIVVELSLRGGVLRGIVQTASEEAMKRVAAHLDRLRTSLEEKGIVVGEFRVVVAGEPEEEHGGCWSPDPHLLDLWA
jgi:flagellar hook-length control protein FliK